MRKVRYEVSDVHQETHDIWSVCFKGKTLDYKPGQFMVVEFFRDGELLEPHPFTISSNPTQKELCISVKSVGDFTSTMRDTEIGDIVYVRAPYGVFSFLNHDAQNLVFIAGGIGITPFRSMLGYIRDSKLERNVVLLWGNKSDKDIPFSSEFHKMAEEISSLKIVHVMSEQDDWEGEKGFINADKFKKYVSDIHHSEFFVCGPPIMMIFVEEALIDLGVQRGRIHSERFSL